MALDSKPSKGPTMVKTALQSAASNTGAGKVYSVDGEQAIALQIKTTGTIAAYVVTPEVSIDGINWIGTRAVRQTTNAVSTTMTADSIYLVNTNGCAKFRARISTFTGGSANSTLTITATPASAPAWEPATGTLTRVKHSAIVGTGGNSRVTTLVATPNARLKKVIVMNANTNTVKVRFYAGTGTAPAAMIAASHIAAAAGNLGKTDMIDFPDEGADISTGMVTRGMAGTFDVVAYYKAANG